MGRLVGRRQTDSNRQMQANYQRFAGAQAADLLPEGVARYFTMFAQTPGLTRYTPPQLLEAVEVTALDKLRADITGGPVVLALTHSGNWDLAGAWCAQFLAPVLTVAERVNPPELFNYFQATRAVLGIEILPAESGVFAQLKSRVAAALQNQEPLLVPLLADRDLSGRGVPAQMAGETLLVGAGPAALAVQLGCPLYAGHLSSRDYYWRGRKYRGVRINLRKVTVGDSVAETTQCWVSAVEPLLSEFLVDWHMMQPVFLRDLDPQRLKRAGVFGEEV